MTRPEQPDGRSVVEAAILECVRDARYRPATTRDLVRALRIPREGQADARRVVRAMLRSGRLVPTQEDDLPHLHLQQAEICWFHQHGW